MNLLPNIILEYFLKIYQSFSRHIVFIYNYKLSRPKLQANYYN